MNKAGRRGGARGGREPQLSLCWSCERAGKPSCEWCMEGEPVPGWDAEPTIVNNSPNRRARSFHVRSCPKFVPYHKRSKIEIGRAER